MDLQSILPAEAFKTEKNSGDYIGEDGLLYCGVCRTKKQTRMTAVQVVRMWGRRRQNLLLHGL